jgi:WhiB family transcriptional regulator, redox-sensing transcriptional regulator
VSTASEWGPLAGYRRVAMRLAALEPDDSWRALAACRSGELPTAAFFPGRGESGEAAKAVCAGCPVRQPCLDFAVATNQPGVWGGTSDRERRQMRRGRSAA